jgi:hypothetical protein
VVSDKRLDPKTHGGGPAKPLVAGLRSENKPAQNMVKWFSLVGVVVGIGFVLRFLQFGPQGVDLAASCFWETGFRERGIRLTFHLQI